VECSEKDTDSPKTGRPAGIYCQTAKSLLALIRVHYWIRQELAGNFGKADRQQE
jgi:hypothetical protein